MKTTYFFGSMGALALSLNSCGSDFDPSSRVVDVRILAVQADAPMAAPGASVNIKALVVDPRQRPLSIGWATCVNPSSTVVNACLAKIAQDAQSSGKPPQFTVGENLDTFSLTVPDDALSSLSEQARANAYVGVVTVACPGQIRLTDSSTWDQQSMPISCVDASGNALPQEDYVVSIKRVWVRETERNKNPVIRTVTFDGATWDADEIKDMVACSNVPNLLDDCDNGQKATVAVGLESASFESGVDDSGTAYDEQLITQFFAQNAAFEFDVRLARDGSTKFALRNAPSGTVETLWLVSRDDRGGVSWVTRKVRVK
ncbi:MAG: hypothetical protein U0165_09125 [Polyangiaceae bacterium]